MKQDLRMRSHDQRWFKGRSSVQIAYHTEFLVQEVVLLKEDTLSLVGRKYIFSTIFFPLRHLFFFQRHLR